MTPTYQNFEAILKETGWGIYNKFILIICSASIFGTTVALSTLPFALPYPIYFRDFSEIEILWIFSAIPMGALFGVITGLWSDIISRKCAIICTLVITFIISFAFGYALELTMHIIFSFLLGWSTSSNILVAKVYLSEILPVRSRGYYLVLMEMISILGYLISSCINWTMQTRDSNVDADSEESWRITFGLPTCICLFIVCFTGLMQPTPRELLAKNTFGSAYLVVKYMFALNTSNHAENFKIRVTDLRGLIDGKTANLYQASRCTEYLLQMFESVSKMMTTIFSKNLTCLFLVSLVRCSLFIGYSGANIWLTKSLSTNFTSKCVITSVDLLYLSSVQNSPSEFNNLIPAHQFFEYFLNGAAMFVGLFIFSYIIDTIGRRVPLMVALLCSGVTITNFPLLESFSIRMTFSMTYMMAFSIVNSGLDVIIIENVPTSTRSTSLVISYVPAIFLSVLSRVIISMDCSMFFYLVGGSAIVASGFCYFLPDLKNLPMVE